MFNKLLIGLLGALIFAFPVAAATPSVQPLQTGEPEDCRECHQITYAHWAESAHANTDGDEVACSTCHNPAPDSHPDKIMPTDISSRMCGDCHKETFAQFETSVHQDNELACVNCHDAHGTTIKTESSAELCEGCHRENVHFFSYTPHAEQGLTCVDCHLNIQDAVAGEAHGIRQHTFSVGLDSCRECHLDEMHYPNPQNEDALPVGEAQAGFLPGSEDAAGSSPFQFVLLAAIVGMGAGLVLSPWIERWYVRVSNQNERS
jgi:predicted CXXCH cytochrome family protein